MEVKDYFELWWINKYEEYEPLMNTLYIHPLLKKLVREAMEDGFNLGNLPHTTGKTVRFFLENGQQVLGRIDYHEGDKVYISWKDISGNLIQSVRNRDDVFPLDDKEGEIYGT